MINWPLKNRTTPIGIDLGTRSIKLVQLSADHNQLVDAVRWDLPPDDEDSQQPMDHEKIVDALKQSLRNRKFRGREAILSLGGNELFLQNLRVPKATGPDLDRLVQQEAAGRIPYSVMEAEIRFLESADIRQGDALLKEVILCACHRPVLDQLLGVLEEARLQPVAVDIESNALIRSYLRQYRRDDDQEKRSMLVHIGFSRTAVVIVERDHTLFIKYIDIGGRDLDAAVASNLKMSLSDATALRRNNGDRRASHQDPEVARSLLEATRPVLDKLVSELSLCIRYHSVTFRGKPLMRIVLGGGEAHDKLCETLSQRLDLSCEMFDPLRGFQGQTRTPRNGQWDVAAGLALREAN